MARKRSGWNAAAALLLALLLLAGCAAAGDAEQAGSDEAVGTEMAAGTADAQETGEEDQQRETADSTAGEIQAAGGEDLSTAPSTSSPAPSSAASDLPDEQGAGGTPPSSASPPARSVEKPSAPTPETESVSLKVIGTPEWGTIIDEPDIPLKEGDTVLDILKRTAKAKKLAIEFRGSGALAYVEGIDGLYEFDEGPASGWKFQVNGEVLGVSAGAYKLQAGDRVVWFYAADDVQEAEAPS